MAESFISNILSWPARVRKSRLRQLKEAETNPHLMDALSENKRQGQILAIKARWVALAVIAVFLLFVNPHWSVIYYEFLLAVLALLGWAQLKAAQVGQSRRELFLIFLDLFMLTIIGILPNPLHDLDWPNAMQYRFGNFQYLFIILAGATMAYSWRTIIAIGFWTFALWAVALLGVLFLGRTIDELTVNVSGAISDYPSMLEFLDPNNAMIGFRFQEIVVFMIVAGILALNGWRNNELVLKQASIARERENLGRYFAPNIVDELAGQDKPFDNIRSQYVAVLFADIVGFTRMAEQGEPEKVVALLREYHKRLEKSVFENSGTLDKFLGDGIMATFGSPVTGPRDAVNAIECARDMVDTVDQWNLERAKSGEAPINLSIGIHYGEVILGDIGSERRLEFATLGDTVNVAARLEEMTRVLETKVIVSDDLVEANRKCEAGNDNHLLDNFSKAGSKTLRGRDSEIDIWKLKAL